MAYDPPIHIWRSHTAVATTTIEPHPRMARVTVLGITDAATTGSFGADALASVSSTLVPTGGTATNSFGFDFDAVASTDGAAKSCSFYALETAVSFEYCGAIVLFD